MTSSSENSSSVSSLNVKVLSELGRGGSGVVFEASASSSEGTYNSEDEKSKILAVKTIKFTSYGVPCPLEVAVMMSINHPHLAKAEMVAVHQEKKHKHGKFHRKLCIVTDKADYDLSTLVRIEKKNRPVRGDLLKEWTRELLSAVYCLHNENLIHADIKTANVLVYDDIVKLSDMTLTTRAKDSNKHLIKHHVKMGTLRYQAPEIREEKGWSFPVDIWSLGCTLFEMAYSVPFFQFSKNLPKHEVKESLNRQILKWKNRNEKTKFNFPPDFYNREMREFNRLVVAMLSYNPDDRPTIKGCFSFPFMEGLSPDSYEIDVVACEKSDGGSWVKRILSYLGDLKIGKNLKMEACKSLRSKIDHKNSRYYDDLSVGEMNELEEAEIKICEFLKWRLL